MRAGMPIDLTTPCYFGSFRAVTARGSAVIWKADDRDQA